MEGDDIAIAGINKARWDRACTFDTPVTVNKLGVWASAHYAYTISMSDYNSEALRFSDISLTQSHEPMARHRLLQIVLATFATMIGFHDRHSTEQLRSIGVVSGSRRSVEYHTREQCLRTQPNNKHCINPPRAAAIDAGDSNGYNPALLSAKTVDATQGFYRWPGGESFLVLLEIVTDDQDSAGGKHGTPTTSDAEIQATQDTLNAILRNTSGDGSTVADAKARFKEYCMRNHKNCVALTLHFFVRHNYDSIQPMRAILAGNTLREGQRVMAHGTTTDDRYRERLVDYETNSMPRINEVDEDEREDAESAQMADGNTTAAPKHTNDCDTSDTTFQEIMEAYHELCDTLGVGGDSDAVIDAPATMTAAVETATRRKAKKGRSRKKSSANRGSAKNLEVIPTEQYRELTLGAMGHSIDLYLKSACFAKFAQRSSGSLMLDALDRPEHPCRFDKWLTMSAARSICSHLHATTPTQQVSYTSYRRQTVVIGFDRSGRPVCEHNVITWYKPLDTQFFVVPLKWVTPEQLMHKFLPHKQSAQRNMLQEIHPSIFPDCVGHFMSAEEYRAHIQSIVVAGTSDNSTDRDTNDCKHPVGISMLSNAKNFRAEPSRVILTPADNLRLMRAQTLMCRGYALRSMAMQNQRLLSQIGVLYSAAQLSKRQKLALRHMYKLGACNNYDRMMRSGSPDISKAGKAIVKYASENDLYKLSSRKVMSKLDKRLDVLSCWHAEKSLAYGSVYGVMNTHLLNLLVTGTLCAYEMSFKLHLHFLLCGPGGEGKTFVCNVLKKLRIGSKVGTKALTSIQEISTFTNRSSNLDSGGLHNNMVVVVNEMPAKLLTGGQGENNTGDHIMKQRLDECRVTTGSTAMAKSKGEAKSSYQESLREAQYIQSAILSTNAYEKLNITMTERLVPIHVLPSKNAPTTVQEHMAIDGMRMTDEAITARQWASAHHFIQAASYEINMLIYTKIIGDVSTHLVSIVALELQRYFNARGVAFLRNRRLRQLQCLSRVLCIEDAIVREFMYNGGRFQQKDLTSERLMALEPLLYVRLNHVIMAMAMLLPYFFIQNENDVRHALHSIFRRRTNQRDRDYMFQKTAPPAACTQLMAMAAIHAKLANASLISSNPMMPSKNNASTARHNESRQQPLQFLAQSMERQQQRRESRQSRRAVTYDAQYTREIDEFFPIDGSDGGYDYDYAVFGRQKLSHFVEMIAHETNTNPAASSSLDSSTIRNILHRLSRTTLRARRYGLRYGPRGDGCAEDGSPLDPEPVPLGAFHTKEELRTILGGHKLRNDDPPNAFLFDDRYFFVTAPIIFEAECIKVNMYWLHCLENGDNMSMVRDALNIMCSKRFQPTVHCLWTPSTKFPGTYNTFEFGTRMEWSDRHLLIPNAAYLKKFEVERIYKGNEDSVQWRQHKAFRLDISVEQWASEVHLQSIGYCKEGLSEREMVATCYGLKEVLLASANESGTDSICIDDATDLAIFDDANDVQSGTAAEYLVPDMEAMPSANGSAAPLFYHWERLAQLGPTSVEFQKAREMYQAGGFIVSSVMEDRANLWDAYKGVTSINYPEDEHQKLIEMQTNRSKYAMQLADSRRWHSADADAAPDFDAIIALSCHVGIDKKQVSFTNSINFALDKTKQSIQQACREHIEKANSENADNAKVTLDHPAHKSDSEVVCSKTRTPSFGVSEKIHIVPLIGFANKKRPPLFSSEAPDLLGLGTGHSNVTPEPPAQPKHTLLTKRKLSTSTSDSECYKRYKPGP